MRCAPSLSVVFVLVAGSHASAAPVLGAKNVHQTPNTRTTAVHGCFGDEHGNLSGQIHQIPMDEEVQEIIDAMNRVNRGVVDNRVDFVFVGDGYTAGEMTQFHADVDGIVGSLYQYEPFKSYQSYFRITAVEVVSNESGVDNDTSPSILRDTALDMNYWCGGTERLLCVNVAKAYNAASAAPDIDQVVAVANSSKYGGAGYPGNNLGTVAGQNGAAADIAIHELGHSLGDLADEYTYGGPTTYTGGELSPVDVSIYERTQQLAENRKWWRWMDASITGFDNPISSYEGGNYSQFGVYRPSNNSMMRALGRPFNLVSAEQLLKEIYREVNPIDDGTPDGTVLGRNEIAWVTPMQPLNHNLNVSWYIDGVWQFNLSGVHTVDISSLGLDGSDHQIRVEVIDGISWVRNTNIRDQFMTESRTFTIEAIVCDADLNTDGEVDFLDISAFISAYNANQSPADFNGDGEYDFLDISAFLGAYNAGCP